MTLTVPTAGSIAGRSASIRVETPETGGILAQFGNALAAKAGEWKQEQVQRQTRQTALDLTRDLGVARQEIEANVTDPAEIGPAWDARRAEIEARYITEDTDPAVAENLRLTAQELGDRHSLALGNRVIGLTQSQRAADWLTTKSRITAEAVNADPETFGAYLELGEASIAELEARGTLSPEQAAAERIALRQEVYGARADALIASDPGAFLEAAKEGEWNVLGDGLASRQKIATTAIAEAQARALKDAETAATERQAEIGRRLGEIATIAGLGRTATDEAWLNSEEVKAHPRYAEAAAAIQLREETPGLRTMTVAEIDRLIAAEEKKPITAQYQNERLSVLRTWRSEAAAKQETDTVGWATGAGLNVPELPDFNPEDPQGFVAGLSRRLAFDTAMREQGYTKGQAVFSADELEDIKAAIDKKADPETRLGIARAFTALGENDARYLLTSVLQADPALLRATELMSMTGSDALARELLRGQQRIETGTVNLPSESNMISVFDDYTGGAFNDNPTLKARLIASAKALYADSSAGIDPDGKDSVVPFMDDNAAVTAFQTAIQRTLGAVPDRSGELTIGGLQEFNGAPVLLPPGVAADDVDSAFDKVREQLSGQWTLETLPPEVRNAETSGLIRTLPAPPEMSDEQKFAFLREASINGSVPDLGPDPEALLATVTLRPVFAKNGRQTDAYELVYMDQGVQVKIRQAGDKDGRPWRFSLSDLIRGTSSGN